MVGSGSGSGSGSAKFKDQPWLINIDLCLGSTSETSGLVNFDMLFLLIFTVIRKWNLLFFLGYKESEAKI